MISCASVTVSQARRNASTSNSPPGPTNFMRFSDARLQAESSRNMYSEQGLEALMRPDALEVCQRLTVVSNCIPGSPHCQVASAICFKTSLALRRRMGWPLTTERVHQSAPAAAASMNSSVARTELLAFWKKIEL